MLSEMAPLRIAKNSTMYFIASQLLPPVTPRHYLRVPASCDTTAVLAVLVFRTLPFTSPLSIQEPLPCVPG
jgi:hypothetical protein